MSGALSPTLLSALSALIEAQMGLHYPEERWPALEDALRLAAPELGFASPADCVTSLLAQPMTKAQVAVLAGHLTVGETYFQRDAKLFALLQKKLLPELIRDRRRTDRRLRLWSAGCCSGEEPYSLAILLRQLLPDWRDWNVTILATDINTGFLRKAAAGVYRHWSFRDAPPTLQSRWFHRRGDDAFEIRDEIKAAVTFSALNLAEDAYPSLLNNTNAMDIILCRNVLLYFSPESAAGVVRNFHRSLAEGGWLIVGPSDASPDRFPQFNALRSDAGILYRKGRGPAPTAPPAAAAAPERTPPPAAMASPPAQPPAAIAAPVQPPPAVLALQARAHANQGNLALARACTEQAIAADKLNAPLHYLMATIIQELGDFEAAVHSLERALYLDQNFILAHFTLGNLTLRQGKPARARKHFENTVALLNRCPPEDLLPESEGLTAARLMQIVRAIQPPGAP